MNTNETMQELVIPGSEQVIRRESFHGGSGLKKVILSAGVKAIRESAFPARPDPECVVIPISVGNIGIAGLEATDKPPCGLPKQERHILRRGTRQEYQQVRSSAEFPNLLVYDLLLFFSHAMMVIGDHTKCPDTMLPEHLRTDRYHIGGWFPAHLGQNHHKFSGFMIFDDHFGASLRLPPPLFRAG